MLKNCGDSTNYGLIDYQLARKSREAIHHETGTVNDCYCHIVVLFTKHCSQGAFLIAPLFNCKMLDCDLNLIVEPC